MVFFPLKTVLARAAAHGAPSSFATAGREALEAKVRDSDAIYHTLGTEVEKKTQKQSKSVYHTWDRGWNKN